MNQIQAFSFEGMLEKMYSIYKIDKKQIFLK